MRFVICIVLAACGGPAAAPPLPPAVVRPAVEGVVLAAEPKQLIVDDDRLYWIGGGDKPGIFYAPIEPGAQPRRLFEVDKATRLVAVGDRLVWAVATTLFVGKKSGGEAAKLVELPGASSSMLDAGRLLVATTMYAGGVGTTVVGAGPARVFEVSVSGELTEQLKLTGTMAELVRDGDAIYVASNEMRDAVPNRGHPSRRDRARVAS
jgi:hypothetical protein